MEHRLVGAGTSSLTQVRAGPFLGVGRGTRSGVGLAPDTLLGPEGSGVKLDSSGRWTALDPACGRTATYPAVEVGGW